MLSNYWTIKKPMVKKSKILKKANEELFQAPAEIMKLETMAAGGVRVVIDTQEITDSNELAKLFRLKKGSVGWFVFKNTEIKGEDVPDGDLPQEEGEKKTPSERMRAVLFVYWKEVKGGNGDFNTFYRDTIEKLISAYKEKLPPKGEDGY